MTMWNMFVFVKISELRVGGGSMRDCMMTDETKEENVELTCLN